MVHIAWSPANAIEQAYQLRFDDTCIPILKAESQASCVVRTAKESKTNTAPTRRPAMDVADPVREYDYEAGSESEGL